MDIRLCTWSFSETGLTDSVHAVANGVCLVLQGEDLYRRPTRSNCPTEEGNNIDLALQPGRMGACAYRAASLLANAHTHLQQRRYEIDDELSFIY